MPTDVINTCPSSYTCWCKIPVVQPFARFSAVVCFCRSHSWDPKITKKRKNFSSIQKLYRLKSKNRCVIQICKDKFSHGDCTREWGETEQKMEEKSEGGGWRGVPSEFVLFITVHAAKLQCSISSLTLWPLSVAGSPVLKDINHCQIKTNHHPLLLFFFFLPHLLSCWWIFHAEYRNSPNVSLIRNHPDLTGMKMTVFPLQKSSCVIPCTFLLTSTVIVQSALWCCLYIFMANCIF